MKDRPLCLPGKLWKAYACLDGKNLKIGFFGINQAPCWVIYSRTWKQIQKGSTQTAHSPWWDQGRRTVADCSQGGLGHSYLFLFSHKFLWILENHSCSGADSFPGHPSSLTLAPVSLARSEAGLGRARIGYRRGEREEDLAQVKLQNMNQAQIICQQFTWAFWDCLHCYLFIYFF